MINISLWGPLHMDIFILGLTDKSSMQMMMQGKPVEFKGTFNSDFEYIYFSSLLKQSSLLDGTLIEL